MSDDDDAVLADAIMARALRDKATRKVNFDELADQLSGKLEALSENGADGDGERAAAARALAKEGRELATRFRSWSDAPPTAAERTETIDAITSFNRRAMDMLGSAHDG